ncbi:MAG: lipoate protein ligase C-terminal domain-containing protein [candidate division KSB1 bacterium]|nr:lipoate protein ligase C-terminal domain-containing protein [candidate division KSB1 bacterium]
MTWRLIIEDGVSAAYGLTADEAVTHRVGRGLSPQTVRLYTYRSHCGLVGRFQTVENEIHLDYCRRHGIEVNRRPTGGGAIIMGADQLGVALMLARSDRTAYGRAREIMAQFSRGLLLALEALGIRAVFRRKNDLEVDCRKIAGLGLYRHPQGGLLFHASLLVDLDIPLMLRVLKTPFEKISDKHIHTVAERMTTVHRELGRAISVDEVREAVARGFARAFELELTPGTFDADERQAIRELEERKYRNPEWIFQTADVPEAEGRAVLKTDGGLLDVRVSLAGRTIKAAYIRGDFFANEQAIADLEAHLRWHSSDADAVRKTVSRVYHQHQHDWSLISLSSLCEAIEQAIEHGAHHLNQSGEQPYGCFVTPDRYHA